MTDLPELMDRNAVARLVFGAESAKAARAAVDAVFRECPTVYLPGLRKPFVRGVAVRELVESCQFDWLNGRVA